ncbi:MAG: tRNA lysidine(34) synthetase TilS [Candidatus Symbiothrix sp.]|nr:tRNA lysidine(34) synthetase TilS [Candidatus Symbiothrix sp.]
MIRKVRRYIESQNLLPGNEKLIVGVSGGADSMVLLFVLQRLAYNCIAAHCNFHLRGEESFRDEKASEEFAQSLQIQFIKKDFDTKVIAQQRGISIEMAARDLRYQWFEELRNEHHAEFIAVAHHQNDNIETLLLNLIRGAGIKGLTGIQPKNNKIVRPLLCASKQEILQFAHEKNIPFVTDSSNLQDEFMRNKIRLNLLPVLQSINPSIDKALLQTMKYLNEAEKIYRKHIQETINQVFDKEKSRIDIALLKQTPSLESVLFEILKGYGFNSEQIKNIAESIDSQSGKLFFSEQYELLRDRSHFLLYQKKEKESQQYEIQRDDTEIQIPIRLQLLFQTIDSNTKIIKNPNIAMLDAAKLQFPLILRKWRQGDKFIPFGMNHFKKISDYFNDCKFSRLAKESTWLLCSGDGIVWIIGHRIDNRFRVSETTKQVYTLQLFRQ